MHFTEFWMNTPEIVDSGYLCLLRPRREDGRFLTFHLFLDKCFIWKAFDLQNIYKGNTERLGT